MTKRIAIDLPQPEIFDVKTRALEIPDGGIRKVALQQRHWDQLDFITESSRPQSPKKTIEAAYLKTLSDRRSDQTFDDKLRGNLRRSISDQVAALSREQCEHDIGQDNKRGAPRPMDNNPMRAFAMKEPPSKAEKEQAKRDSDTKSEKRKSQRVLRRRKTPDRDER